MTKLFIIGSNGLLGRELVKQAKLVEDLEIFTSDRSDKGSIDITSKASISKFLKKIKPDWVINCAAYTNVDACEDKDGYKIAEAVNGLAVGELARQLLAGKINFIHISTDYVFGDNKQEGYSEEYNKFNPLNNYAKTKLLGEQEILRTIGQPSSNISNFKLQDPKFYIVRTSWLFGLGAVNFITKVLELAKSKPYLEVVTDEYSSPTYAKELVKRLLYLVKEQPLPGIYHAGGLGMCSRYEFAKEVFHIARIKVDLRKIKSESFTRKANIASYSYLRDTKLNTKNPIKHWKMMVADYVRNELDLGTKDEEIDVRVPRPE